MIKVIHNRLHIFPDAVLTTHEATGVEDFLTFRHTNLCERDGDSGAILTRIVNAAMLEVFLLQP